MNATIVPWFPYTAAATANVTQPERRSGSWDLEEDAKFIVPLAVLIACTCVMNLLVMVVVHRDRKLMSHVNVYVFSLALCDMCVGILVMPGMVYSHVNNSWRAGPIMCATWVAMDYSLCSISMLHLLLIAVDRYRSNRQLNSYMFQSPNRRLAVVKCLAAWFLGIAVWLPPVIYYQLSDQKFRNPECVFSPNFTFIMVQSVFVYYIPVITMTVLYAIILCSINKRHWRKPQIGETTKIRRSASDSILALVTAANIPNISLLTAPAISLQSISNPGVWRNISHNHIAGNRHVSTEILPKHNLPWPSRHSIVSDPAVDSIAWRQRRRQARANRTLGAVMALFLVGWLPFFIVWPLDNQCDCISPSMYRACYWLTYLQSAINPALYFLLNRDFRKALLKILGSSSSNLNKANPGIVCTFHLTHWTLRDAVVILNE